MNNRAGVFIKQPSGFKTFLPNKLPPDKIKYDSELISLLSKADIELGRLDGVTQTLPDPDLFVGMYVQKEAVLSSQIEGTQASLTDVLRKDEKNGKREDILEIVHYVKAMHHGLNALAKMPLSLRLIKDIHAILLESGRGSKCTPGEFRSTQNWIGPAGSTLSNATFIPPTVPEMKTAMGDLELFIHDESDMPPLIKIALIHAQFESIHPFLDGNGRMGRLLITFWLCHKKILSKPLLYLSYYFKLNRSDYYEMLMKVRVKGDWESWLKFFLKGIIYISTEAITTAKEILALKSVVDDKVAASNSAKQQAVIEYLFTAPIVTIKSIVTDLGISKATTGRIVDNLCDIGVLKDATPERIRNKYYEFTEYIKILNEGTELSD